jgi:hypothetical protein
MTKPAGSSPGYETRDISVRAVTWFGIGLMASCLVILPIVFGLYHWLEHVRPSPDSPSRIVLHPRMLAPAPQLQTNPSIDLAQVQAAADAKLNSYGWVDKQARIIHIPIARAMDLISERGLPARGPGTQNASGITPVQMQSQKAAATRP